MPKFERKIEIDAPVEKVWEVLTNPDFWPQWFPGVDAVSNVTSISPGGSFDWVKDEVTGKGTIETLQPFKLLEIRTQVGNDKDAHIFKLRPSGGLLGLSADECKVDYTMDTLMGGGIFGDFFAGGNPKDALRVKKAMHLLRKVVESK